MVRVFPLHFFFFFHILQIYLSSILVSKNWSFTHWCRALKKAAVSWRKHSHCLTGRGAARSVSRSCVRWVFSLAAQMLCFDIISIRTNMHTSTRKACKHGHTHMYISTCICTKNKHKYTHARTHARSSGANVQMNAAIWLLIPQRCSLLIRSFCLCSKLHLGGEGAWRALQWGRAAHDA